MKTFLSAHASTQRLESLMLQSHVPPQVVPPAYLPAHWADTILAWDLLSNSIVPVSCPEMTVDGPRLCRLLAAGRHGA